MGSSKRDHEVEVDLLGERFRIKRVGTDGDIGRAVDLLQSLDGQVDAFGLGGIDLYLYAGDKRYTVREAATLKDAVKKSPVVDGSGLKNTLEREVVRYLAKEGFELRGKRVLMVSAVDRFGLAEALHESGCRMIFGDLIFALGIPLPLRSYGSFRFLAKVLLPVVTWLPIKILYPTGTHQDRSPTAKYQRYYDQSDIIAGDFLLIRKYLPPRLDGKWIITNTVTEEDVEDLRDRGIEWLITTTPELRGRSFGTNVLEATLLAILNKRWEDVGDQDYLELLERIDFKPRLEKLN